MMTVEIIIAYSMFCVRYGIGRNA